MPRRKMNAATATPPLTIVTPPDALDPPYAGEPEAQPRAVEYDADVLGENEPEDEPAPELAPATVSAPTFVRAMPRRVSAETVKAETKLIRLEKAAQASLVACEQRWADKRRDFIRALPHDVQGMLLAGGVIDEDDCEVAP